jgi:hypothetical protein
MKKLILCFLSIIITLFLLAGCATFSKNTLPLRSYNDITTSNNGKLNSIDYELLVENNGHPEVETYRYISYFEETMKNSKLFNKVYLDKGKEQYHLILKATSNYSEAALLTAIGVTIGTLGLVPTFCNLSYELNISVLKDGKELKEYHYQEKAIIWNHLIMLFYSNPGKVDKEICENMFLNFLYDLKKDGYILN